MSPLAIGLVSGLIFGAVDAAVAADIDAKRVYLAARPSIVLITTSDATGSDIAVGTGFAVGDGTTVVTNLHVIREATSVRLRKADGGEYPASYALGYDRVHDLVLLESSVALPPLMLRDERPAVGETVFAIGNPEGLEASLSQGLVSGIREVRNSLFYQISAPISHGSSGGPLLDSSGRVIGVTTFMLEGGQNLNFSIPIAYVKSVLANIARALIATLPPAATSKDYSATKEISRLWKEGLRASAKKRAAEFLKQNEMDPKVTEYVAGLLFCDADWYEAIELYEKTFELDRSDPYRNVCWFYIAKAYNHKERYNDALRAFKQVVNLADTSRLFLWEVYQTQLAAGKYADAENTAAIIRRKNEANHVDALEEDEDLLAKLSHLSHAELTRAARVTLHQWTIRDSESCLGPPEEIR